MTYILAFETSSIVCSIALFQHEKLVALSELQIEKSHSSHITVLIEQMLHNSNLILKDISAVAVSGGPGSYTGLRIGCATAKGLCYALNIPLIEVSTLHALAYSLIQNIPNASNFLFCPMIDARRLEVYTCLLDNNLQELLPVAPVILTENAFDEFITKQPVIFFGSGATKFKNLRVMQRQALFVTDIQLSAKSIGSLAYIKYQKFQFEDIAYYEPFYLKEVYITTSTKANL